MTRSGRPGLGSEAEAGAAPFWAQLASASDADVAPNAPVREARPTRRPPRAVRRLGDARPVRGRDPRAPRRAPGLRRLRRLPHGRARGRGAAGARAAPDAA